MEHDELGHARGQVVVHHARDGDAGRQVPIHEDVVDPGAKGKDRLQVGKAL